MARRYAYRRPRRYRKRYKKRFYKKRKVFRPKSGGVLKLVAQLKAKRQALNTVSPSQIESIGVKLDKLIEKENKKSS